MHAYIAYIAYIAIGCHAEAYPVWSATAPAPVNPPPTRASTGEVGVPGGFAYALVVNTLAQAHPCNL